MSASPYYSRVEIKNIGPFREASLELRPLTILIGRNASGKSFLMRLLWALGATMPDIEVMMSRLRGHVMEFLRRRDDDSFGKLVRELVKVFPEAYSVGLSRTLLSCFEVRDVRELLRDGSSDGLVRASNVFAELEVTLSRDGRISARWIRHPPDDLVDRLSFGIKDGLVESAEATIKIVEGFCSAAGVRVDSETAAWYVASTIIPYLAGLVGSALPPLAAHRDLVALMIDGRSGVIRAWSGTALSEREFLRLARELYNARLAGQIDLKPLASLMRELGCTDIRIEGGVDRPLIKVRMWDGRELEIERAPSGVRECLIPCLLMLRRLYMPCFIYFEEPEAHLHPRAIEEAAKLVVYVIRREVEALGRGGLEYGKLMIVISTHSLDLVYAINNMILLASVPEDRRREVAKRTGYVIDGEVLSLDHRLVSAYLVVRDDERGESTVKEIKVSREGVNEEHFAAISEEMLNRRSNIVEFLR